MLLNKFVVETARNIPLLFLSADYGPAGKIFNVDLQLKAGGVCVCMCCNGLR
jgi:hypothetical protein